MAQSAAVEASIDRATVGDLNRLLAEHHRYWGDRDLRHLHLAALVHEFGETCLVVRDGDGLAAYLLGFVTPARAGYIHAVATRDDARGRGLGRCLYEAFTAVAGAQGATTLKAITSPGNTGSIAFHRALGFDASVIEDYNGPGRPMVVFTRAL